MFFLGDIRSKDIQFVFDFKHLSMLKTTNKQPNDSGIFPRFSNAIDMLKRNFTCSRSLQALKIHVTSIGVCFVRSTVKNLLKINPQKEMLKRLRNRKDRTE